MLMIIFYFQVVGNYQKKIEIICEAIKTNTLIVNTKSYLDITEGVK